MKNLKYLIITLLLLAFAGCDVWKDELKGIDGSDRSKTLYELLLANSELSNFVKAVDAAGYAEKLGADMNYTVFAPNNNAILGVDLSSPEKAAEWLKNYISQSIAYADNSGAFAVTRILMLNSKYVPINGNLISGAAVSKSNISAKNGVLHIIDGTVEERLNIWEYLQTLTNEPTVDFIASFGERVMDMERSVQTGVNNNGKPVYDTVWTVKNTLLDASPLAKEGSTAVFLLLDKSGFDALKVKYAKYFAQKNPAKLDSVVTREIVSDMILRYAKIDADGRFSNTSGVLVDVNKYDITSTYNASNGIVYHVKAAGVKFYKNKIKNVTIEAEDYVTRWPDAWMTRPRTWARGGKDVVLKSRTRHSYDWEETVHYQDTIKNATGNDTIVSLDSIRINRVNNLFNLTYRANEWPGDVTLGEPNAYISYKPRMYSVPYKIFWKAYDDNAEKNHIDSRGVPMLFHQKMYISFPNNDALERTSDNIIKNNFLSNVIMAAEMHAGENIETQLVRYSANNGVSVYPNCFALNQPTKTADAFGSEGILNCPYAGEATLFVSNTTKEKFDHINKDGSVTTQAYLVSAKASNSPGMIFLDYIRLEPQVDAND